MEMGQHGDAQSQSLGTGASGHHQERTGDETTVWTASRWEDAAAQLPGSRRGEREEGAKGTAHVLYLLERPRRTGD